MAVNVVVGVLAAAVWVGAVTHVVRQPDAQFDRAGIGPRRLWLMTTVVLGPLWCVAYLVYAVPCLRRTQAAAGRRKGWGRAVILSFVAYVAGVGSLGFVAIAAGNVVGQATLLLAISYFLAGIISGIVALWHGPTLRALRGRCLLSVAAAATVTAWLVATQVPSDVPDFLRPVVYRYLVRLNGPGLVGALIAPLAWHRLDAPPTHGHGAHGPSRQDGA